MNSEACKKCSMFVDGDCKNLDGFVLMQVLIIPTKGVTIRSLDG